MRALLLVHLLAVVAVAAAAPAPPVPPKPVEPEVPVELKEAPPLKFKNGNALITKHAAKLKLDASSFWLGWPVEKIVDGNVETAWFSARGDAAALKKSPWVEVEFPEDVTLTHVTIVGNREPVWLKGFTILSGRLEVFDKDGKVIFKKGGQCADNFRDFDFKPDKPLTARKFRFTSTSDQGDLNGFDDIAISEVQAE